MAVVRVRVLGSGAGGGVPQWNCGCPNCRAARAGDPRVRPRTQDGLAFSVDDVRWHLVNASPDLLRQIEQTPALHPRSARHSPIRSIVLTNGDLDHVLGLFSLRESWPLVLYATDAVRRGLEEGNVIFRTLQRFPGQVTWRRLSLGAEVELEAGLVVEARPAPGKLPVHLMGIAQPSPEDNVSLWIRDTRSGTRVAVATATSSADGTEEAFRDADCVFFDGTFWSSDELARLGLGTARAEDMAHLPIGGPGGSLERLGGLRVPRKVFTHINNSNPILVDGSPEQKAVRDAGWEIAFDGMELVL
jgi:pyrroloquinoline quinone biosynthesis protein B